jgi:hypothetical protein
MKNKFTPFIACPITAKHSTISKSLRANASIQSNKTQETLAC